MLCYAMLCNRLQCSIALGAQTGRFAKYTLNNTQDIALHTLHLSVLVRVRSCFLCFRNSSQETLAWGDIPCTHRESGNKGRNRKLPCWSLSSGTSRSSIAVMPVEKNQDERKGAVARTINSCRSFVRLSSESSRIPCASLSRQRTRHWQMAKIDTPRFLSSCLVSLPRVLPWG